MDFTAQYRFARISPRKAMLVVDLVRGRSLNEAYTLLATTKRRGAVYVRKLLDSAQHNAVDRDPQVSPDALFVKEIVVGRGPILKRYHARAKGRGCPILKRMSHFRVVLSARQDAPARRRRARAAGAATAPSEPAETPSAPAGT